MAPSYSVGVTVVWIIVSMLVPRAPIRRTLGLLRPLGWAAVVLSLLVLAGATFVSVYTNLLWFRSIGDSSEYERRLVTEIVMFVLFGGVTAAALGVTTWVAAHLSPSPAAGGVSSRLRSLYTRLSRPVRILLLTAIPVIAGLRAGFAAASRWQLWSLWHNATTFGRTDPRFGRDDGYYVFVYPFHRYVVSGLISIVTIAIVSVVVIGWLRGAVQLRGTGPRMANGLGRTLSVLVGVLAVVKAAAYWLDRFATVTSSRGVTTGQSYTDLHVVVPAKLALMIVALVLAVGFFLNAVTGSLRRLLAGVAVMVVAGVLAGGVIPALVQTFEVKPAAIQTESTSIARNIAATRFAFGLDGVTTGTAAPSSAAATTAATSTSGARSARRLARSVAGAVQPRLFDPNVVSPTFTQLQQRESYYGFKSTLDVDRYDINGRSTDEVLAVRELRTAGLQSQTWTNQHLVYTHGIGVVAAPMAAGGSSGLPRFNQSGIPSSGVFGNTLQDRIYFGQLASNYSIVGAPGGHGIEFDHPGAPSDYDYSGGGGVPVGSLWRRFVYALRFGDKNILFSSDLNADSQLLYRRSPAARIATVAPWLTLDGDIYPVVAGGRVTWVADGYTTSSQFPDSQETNLRSATATTYVKQGANAAQPSTNVNYIRNSVVATVDAYTGAVHLYVKPGSAPDPVLRTWMATFPHLVQPSAAIPSDLQPHLRYPQDLFNLQRTLLAKYHVTSPTDFYAGTQFWVVPGDPTVSAAVSQPSYYATTTLDGGRHFALSTPLLTLNRNNVAAYLSVDCDPGPGYGRLQVTTFPSAVPTESPAQLQNDIESDPVIAQQLTLERGGQSAVKVGNLQTAAVDGQVLAIEPIYTQSVSGKKYPILRNVVVVLGSGRPGFASGFIPALDRAVGVPGSAATATALAAKAATLLQQLQAAQAAGSTQQAADDARRLQALLGRIQQSSG